MSPKKPKNEMNHSYTTKILEKEKERVSWSPSEGYVFNYVARK
jgi:hypothetical protein